MTSFFMPCPLCGERAHVLLVDHGRAKDIDCPGCGRYVVAFCAEMQLIEIQGDVQMAELMAKLKSGPTVGFLRYIEFNSDHQEVVINILPAIGMTRSSY